MVGKAKLVCMYGYVCVIRTDLIKMRQGKGSPGLRLRSSYCLLITLLSLCCITSSSSLFCVWTDYLHSIFLFFFKRTSCFVQGLNGNSPPCDGKIISCHILYSSLPGNLAGIKMK